VKLVSVVLATYRPNIKFLQLQLKSIFKQDYPNIELIVCDDSCDDVVFEEVRQLVESLSEEYKIKTTIVKNEKNKGSNKTFERLTTLATGEYIAYCDQDDMWEHDKITTLVNKIEAEKAVVAYSDLAIIDEDNQVTSKSFKDVSKRLNHIQGDKAYDYFIRRNSITGCTMLIKTEIAKESLPFPDFNIYVHDHWLALYASCRGKVAYVERPLVKYRIHSNNQIGAKVLSGISDKETYISNKLEVEKQKVQFVSNRNLHHVNKDFAQSLKTFENFVQSRVQFFENKSLSNSLRFLSQAAKDPVLITFELLINILPSGFSKNLIQKAKG